MCFVSNQTRLKFSNIFNNIANTRTIEFDVFVLTEKKNTQTTNLTIIALNTTFNENQSCQKSINNIDDKTHNNIA